MTAEKTMPKTTEKKSDNEKWNALRLADFLEDHWEIGTSTEGRAFAVPRGERSPRRAVSIRSLDKPLRKLLREKHGVAVSRETMTICLDTVEASAEDREPVPVHLRVARKQAAIEVDLADRSGAYVEVSAFGWELRNPGDDDEPTPSRAIWKRSSASQPLSRPERGGDRDDLRRLLGLAEDDPRWKLLWGWAVASFFADIPRPILWCLGPQGSGKTTRAKMILNLVDPVNELGPEPGRNERDDTTSAAGRYIPSWDNIGKVAPATSDWLCRLVTGMEVSRRALYTDDDLRVSSIKRAAVATSIVLPFGLGPDALERLALVEFERLPDTGEARRRPEEALWAEYRRVQPSLLGALYDDVAGVLANRRQGEASGLPRMADYCLVLRALDRHLGFGADDGYAAAYTTQVHAVMADRAVSDPLTAALIALVDKREGDWEGTATELLDAIAGDRPDDYKVPWPATAIGLGAILKGNSELLRHAGLEVGNKRSHSKRLTTLTRVTKPEPAAPTGDDAESITDEAVDRFLEDLYPASALRPLAPATAKLQGPKWDLADLYPDDAGE